MLANTPGTRYSKIMNAITSNTPIKPAIAVLAKASLPNSAETTFELISVNLTGNEPELIKLANVLASSSVKLPEIMQSPVIVEVTLAAEIYLGS